jgi:iron complex transport system substrate-binding protein
MLNMKYRKLLPLILSFLLVFSFLTSCSSANNKESKNDVFSFTDSLGRTVEIPEKISRVASSGPLSDIILYTVCPDKIVGWATKFPQMTNEYIDSKYLNLPVYGQYYGKNANMNIEALVAAKPEIIIDIGEAKPNIAESLDKLQNQVGIPVVFIESSIMSLDKTYNIIGEILNLKDKTSPLSNYCLETINMAKENSAKISDNKKCRIYYGTGANSLTATPNDSTHATVLGLVGAVNVAVFPNENSSADKPISIEQVINWNPDTILVDPSGIYNNISNYAEWNNIDAAAKGHIYEIPDGPYNFLGRPPSVNQMLGIRWLGNLLYPDIYNYDIVKQIKEFYSLFYHYNLTDEQAKELLSKSTFK